MELFDKVALITGGTRIGQTVAVELARRGCHIALVYNRSKSAAEATLREAKELGVRTLSVQTDLRRKNSAAQVMGKIKKQFGRLDILIHMASVYQPTPLRDLVREPLQKWESSFEIDLRAAYLLSLKAAPLMLRNGGGRIINFSDWIAASGRPRYKDRLPYYVAKTGAKGLTEALALELAPRILVNSIAPGPILPPKGLSRRENRAVTDATPLGRWGGPQEIAKAVLFFIESDFVTGECLRVDGGRHLY
jgi:NAD(P)-dependent dehydrogenase (short-subunit alcohol dehydrogenase family)